MPSWRVTIEPARLLGGIAFAATGLLTVVPQPNASIWQISLLVSELGHWLVLPALVLLLLPGWRGSRMSATGSVFAAIGIVLLLLPLAEALAISGGLPAALREAFDRVPPHPSPFPRPGGKGIASSGGEGTRRPFSIRDLLRGVPSDDVLIDEHVYAVVDGHELRLDLYRAPSTQTSRPVVITIHGGSWRSGNRDDFADLNRYLAARGYIVATIEYRLAPRWRFPAAQEDVAAAISYIKTLGETARVDPNRIALIGRSAGGQIALLAAFTAHDPAIRGVVSYYGPAALRWGYENPAKKAVIDSSAILEEYLGGSPATHGARYNAAEPSTFVEPTSPPTLFIQGLRDELVSPFHNEFVSARLIEAGVPHFILRLPWAVHGCDYIFNGPCGQLSTYAVEWFLRTVMS